MDNIEFYEVKNVNKTIINFVFNIDYNRDDIIKKQMMIRMLSNYTNKLKTAKNYVEKRKSLYIMDYDSFIIKMKDSAVLNIRFVIPKIDILNDFNLEAAIKFMFEVLFKPYVSNNQFNIKAFNCELNYLKSREKDYPHSISEYAYDKFLDFVDESNKMGLHYDEYINYLNTVNSKTTYDYYLKSIKNNGFKIYVFGNKSDKNDILVNLSKVFKNDNSTNKISSKKYDFFSIVDYKEKLVETNYNQSVLSLFYQFQKMSSKDLIKLEMLYYFLNSRENNLLYNELRYKNQLIYTSHVEYSMYYGVISLVVFLDYELLDKVEETINLMLKQLKNKENYELYKKRLVKAIEYDILDNEDDPFYVVQEVFNKKYSKDNILKLKLKKINDMTFESFTEFLNRMVLTRKMVMKSGDKNDKKN